MPKPWQESNGNGRAGGGDVHWRSMLNQWRDGASNAPHALSGSTLPPPYER